jgi:hypothetical protein
MNRRSLALIFACCSSLPTVLRAEPSSDDALIRLLLEEKLEQRTFAFSDVVRASSGKNVITLDPTNVAHHRITTAVEAALQKALPLLSQADSPVRKLRRINEASRYFEDALMATINATSGLRCESPPTRTGATQRSGYPDLRITDIATGTIAYLDPKLLEGTSLHSTLRTFYYEPKHETLKINDNAIHLLCGIEHDGKESSWTFTRFHLIDLSTLRVRLKAEFQASNADLYQKVK